MNSALQKLFKEKRHHYVISYTFTGGNGFLDGSFKDANISDIIRELKEKLSQDPKIKNFCITHVYHEYR